MVPIIGAACGLGGRLEGSGKGPEHIKSAFFKGVEWRNILHPPITENKIEQLYQFNQALAKEVYTAVATHPLTCVIGGDHSCAIGTWSAVAQALSEEGKEMALLWIDAHMDAHTPQTSPSGNVHGMPLATLLGHGDKRFTQILSKQPKVKPEHLFLIGIRSYEEEEKALLERLNVRVYYIEEVQKRGLEAIFSEIVSVLKAKGLSYGLSVDIDFFDPEKMSATGTPEAGGIDPLEFIEHYGCFDGYPPRLFEFVEFNPSRDHKNQSLEWTKKILTRAIIKK